MKSKTIIYHNPKCSKSREALALVKESGNEITIIEYLKNTPTAAELEKLIDLLQLPAEKLVRKKEPIYTELYKGKTLDHKQWIAAMVAHPKLIERPIVVKGNKAVIGRPTSLVIDLLN